jgi:DNA-binding transcriptional LysR family regulator
VDVRIESRQLRQLVTLARSGSFSAAARRLALTEPALLRNVQTLERELDLRLFHRRRGGIALTPAGEIVVGRAQLLVEELEGLRRALAHAETSRRASLRVAAGLLPRVRLLPLAVARFTKTRPRMRIDVRVGAATGFLQALLREEIDVFIGDPAEAVSDPRFEVLRLKPEAVAWICRPGHPLAACERVELAQLGAYPVATPTLPSRMLAVLDVIAPRSHVRCDDVLTLRQLALQDDTVALLPTSFVADDLANGTLFEIRVNAPPVVSEIAVVLRMATRAAEPIASFIEAIRFADFGENVPPPEREAPRAAAAARRRSR